ncbi:hypothetical protein [Nostoc sp.]|uniref:hypothetical protein n=1 Tax=Nostoc sp. TaxID=1180 RepID=UPI002FF6D0FE
MILKVFSFGDWGLGTGDWGLGIRDWGLGIGDRVREKSFPLCSPHPAPLPLVPHSQFTKRFIYANVCLLG